MCVIIECLADNGIIQYDPKAMFLITSKIMLYILILVNKYLSPTVRQGAKDA